MSLTCLIFDDESAAIAKVSFLLGKHAPNWEILGIASTISECRSLLQEHAPNIIFSDIHFGKDIIFDVLPELKTFKGDIVFISGDNAFAAQAFQLSATSYILKPINENHFVQLIQKYQFVDLNNINNEGALVNDVLYHNLKENRPSYKKIAFNTNSGYIIKKIDDILYAKANSNYTEIYFADKEKIIATKTMLEYERLFSEFNFFRIHHSYIVNFEHVLKFDSDELKLYLTTGEIIPVSTRKKVLLLEILRKIF